MQKKNTVKEKKKFDPKNIIKMVPQVDWSKIPNGTWIKGKLNDKTFIGRINTKQLKDVAFICQNIKSGRDCTNKFGFRYSRSITKDQSGIEEWKLEFLPEMPKRYIQEKFYKLGDYDVIFYKGYIRVGCKKIYNKSVREITANLKNK